MDKNIIADVMLTPLEDIQAIAVNKILGGLKY
jgi:hypothetical protein